MASPGVRILPTIDPERQADGRHALGWCLLLVPVTSFPSALGMAGTLYAVGALGLTLAFVARRSASQERRPTAGAELFLTSDRLAFPVLTLLVADRLVPEQP